MCPSWAERLNMSDKELKEFSDRLHELMPSIIKGFMRNEDNELKRGSLTITQFLILNYLSHQPKAIMKDLANFMEVSTAAMTGLIERLVRDGYASREFDPKDRRIIRVVLTSKGDTTISRILKQRRQKAIGVFGKLSAQEREDYLRILTHIHQILEQEKKKK